MESRRRRREPATSMHKTILSLPSTRNFWIARHDDTCLSTSTFRKLKQENPQFRSGLGYTASSNLQTSIMSSSMSKTLKVEGKRTVREL